MPLEVKCTEHLAKTRAFADTLGAAAREQLESKLSYLEHYRNDTCVCELFSDSTPHSFYFNLLGPAKDDGSRERWFNGGLIYFGPHETGVGGPQYSVSLAGATGGAEANTARWEVHT
jgi:hypothetical protein